jgi:hypothetical protein
VKIMTATAKVYSQQYGWESISGDTLGDAVERNFRALVKPMELGSAAGYRLHRVAVEVAPKNHWIVASGITLITNPGTKPADAVGRPAKLVVEHTGLDLAHRPASKEIKRSERSMVVACDAESCEIAIG